MNYLWELILEVISMDSTDHAHRLITHDNISRSKLKCLCHDESHSKSLQFHIFLDCFDLQWLSLWHNHFNVDLLVLSWVIKTLCMICRIHWNKFQVWFLINNSSNDSFSHIVKILFFVILEIFNIQSVVGFFQVWVLTYQNSFFECEIICPIPWTPCCNDLLTSKNFIKIT